MQRKKDSLPEYSVDDSTRMAPYLTYEGIMLMQVNRCNDSYSNRHVNFSETTRILEFCSIPLMSKKDYESQEAKIAKMSEKKEKLYSDLAKHEFLSNVRVSGFYADKCNQALFQKIQSKYYKKMKKAVAEESYKLLLDNGRIKKTFRSKTGSERL